jgi:hypothetical protein
MLRARHVQHRHNLIYRLSRLERFVDLYSEQVRDSADELFEFDLTCVRAGQTKSIWPNLETLGDVYLRYVVARGDELPLAAGKPEDMLTKAEVAFRICRDQPQSETEAGDIDATTPPIVKELNLASIGQLHTRCLAGLQKVETLRDD